MRVTLLIAASLLATACNAPTAETETESVKNDAGGAFAEEPPAAQQFAATMAKSDMYEIAAANVALDAAEEGKVREFAQMMIADHTKSTEALKAAVAASGENLAMPTELDAEQRERIDNLRSNTGARFDREYLSQQLAAHSKTLALLKAYGANGDTAELRQFAQATIPTVQNHHDWLEDNWPMPVGTTDAIVGSTPTP